MVATAVALGLPAEEAIRIIGVSPDLLGDPSARVRHDVLVLAWTEIPRQLDDVSFGLRAAELAVDQSFDVLDHAFAQASTLLDALASLARYQRLLHDANDVRIDSGPKGHVCVSQKLKVAEKMPDHLADFIVAQWILRAERLSGARPSVLRVELTRSMPNDVEAHRRFFPAAIAFGAERNAAYIDEQYLRSPVLRSDPSLSLVLRRHADDLLAQLPASDSISAALDRFLLGALGSEPPDVQKAASALRVSVRTLQRKLEEEGTSFTAVLDEVRRKLALSYLRDPGRTVSEVAFLVGFSEVSAFSRAFRRWTGRSAVSYRRSPHA